MGFIDRSAFSGVIAQGVARPIVETPRGSQNQTTVTAASVETAVEAGVDTAAYVDALRTGVSAIVAGDPSVARSWIPAARRIAERIDACEARAHAIAAAGGGTDVARRLAAVEFLGDTVAAVALDGAGIPGAARRAVLEAAPLLDLAPGAAHLAVYLRALANPEAAQLLPRASAEFIVSLLVELGPVSAASLWSPNPTSRRPESLASAGEAALSRRMREGAAATLAGKQTASPQVHAVSVARWDRPFAALVARGNAVEAARLRVWLHEAAAALSPVLERDTLFESRAARESELVSGTERRLVRLGFDLHDGPLQEVVALAADLRIAREQLSSVLGGEEQALVAGRFDDFHARLESLDASLRQLAHSIRSTSAVERPLEDVLRNELYALTSRTGIAGEFSAQGCAADLTDSQKIVLYRVVQEALANVRKHSNASRVDVRMQVKANYVSITVADDGCGFDGRTTMDRALRSDRLGLAGISERVRLLGGAVDIEACAGNGVVVRATLPRWRPVLERAPTGLYAVPA
jgi:signal transduction histidine kinase